jgi:GT2 family glycosyltransferase
MTPHPTGRSLPLDRRVRAEIVAGLAVLARRSGPVLERIVARVPSALRVPLSRAAAPLRVVREPLARVPLGTAFPSRPAIARAANPPVSIVVVSHDGCAHLELCLGSIRAYTEPSHYEVIVVDNASVDGTQTRLAALAEEWPQLSVVTRTTNEGFPAAVNAGVRASTGDVLVVCNHDIVVTPGWLEGLLRGLDHSGTGLAGPVTNDSGDAATVDARYGDLVGLLDVAAARGDSHRGRSRVVDKLSLFCAATPRRVFDACGGLDVRYGLGMFDDDDLCAAIRTRDLDVRLVEDVYVHHTAGVAFRALAERDYVLRFELNRLRWERKWGRRWRVPSSP